MVVLDDKKYACETCIKGHRSSTCKHNDRPLFEIKKKGRPVTQCDHCRELRKTKQVHVKCLCEGHEDSGEPSAPGPSKKGGTKMPTSAAFPNGLPENLGASLALKMPSEGLSDSERGESSSSCSCKAGGPCYCCMPRKSAPKKRRRKTLPDEEQYPSRGSPVADPSLPSSQVLARIAELRPVLPRPSNRSPHSARPVHDPSLNQASPIRHIARENLLYSPYGRAYDMSHGSEYAYGRTDAPGQHSPQDYSQNSISYLESTQPQDVPSNVQSWLSTNEHFPSTCKCGDGCACPGCVEHNGGRRVAPDASVFSSCANPGACSHCLDCTILSLPSSVPPNTALSIYDPSEAQSIDDWIRQISARAATNLPMSLPPNLVMTPAAPWETFQPPQLQDPRRTLPFSSACCGGRCKCPPGSCTCAQDCCGCCQDCECAEHEPQAAGGGGAGGSVRFATSRERGACCSGAMKGATRSLDSFHLPGGGDGSAGPLSRRVSHAGYLEVPPVHRSRSESQSPTYCTDYLNMFATPRPPLPSSLPSSSSSSSSTSSSAQHFVPSSDMDMYAASVPDSELSTSDDQHYEAYPHYHHPSLDGMQLYQLSGREARK